MAAALATIFGTSSGPLAGINQMGSLFFGLAMVLCLWQLAGLRSFRSIIFLLLAAVVAAAAGTISAMSVNGTLFGSGTWDRPVTAPIAFTGGFVGAFIVMAAVLFLYSEKRLRLLIQAARWALAGGAFAVLGWASAGWFNEIRSQARSLGLITMDNGLNKWGEEELAMMILWQTGMGLVIALAVWRKKKGFTSDGISSGAASQSSP